MAQAFNQLKKDSFSYIKKDFWFLSMENKCNSRSSITRTFKAKFRLAKKVLVNAEKLATISLRKFIFNAERTFS